MVGDRTNRHGFFFEHIGANDFRPLPPVEDWGRFKLAGVDPVSYYTDVMQVPEYASRLRGWGGPAVVDMDAMFFHRELPPAFEEAIALTRHALEEWKRIAERDRFRLVVVATSNLTRGEVDALSDRHLYLNRFREIVETTGLPFLDLYPIFAKQPDLTLGSWRHDSHWNQTGHQWAADALYRYLTDGGLLMEWDHDDRAALAGSLQDHPHQKRHENPQHRINCIVIPPHHAGDSDAQRRGRGIACRVPG
jgi:hypothetical protein